MIEIKDLHFSYREEGFALKVPELSIGRDEKIAIVGPSGTGKTTLINLLAGVLLPNSGTISFDNIILSEYDWEDLQDLRILKIGLVFQEFELLEYLTVLDNILLPYRINPILELTSTVKERAEHLANEVGIGDKLSRRPANLSQGERQRTAVCRALLTKPSIIFGDEPTGNLDPDNRDQVMEILLEYCNQSGAPLVIVTHDQELLVKFERTIDVREFLLNN